MHDTEYNGPERRLQNPDIALLSVKFDTLHQDVSEIKFAIREMTYAVNKLAVIEDVRQQMLGKRLAFMTRLDNWAANAKGWSRRIASILEM